MKGSSIQFSSVTQLCPTLWDHTDCSTSAFPVHHHLLELAQTHGHRVSDAIQPSHPLPSPSHSAFNLSQHLVFSNELVLCIRLPKYLSFSFSISPSNEYSGLFSFRIEQFDCLEVQGTLKSLLQHHSSKASILWHSAFFMVQLSHPYMTTGKKHSLDQMDLCQQSLVIAFLPRSKRLLISQLQSQSAVILELKKINSVTVSIVSLSGPDATIFVF